MKGTPLGGQVVFLKLKSMEFNIDWWGEDDWYILPTLCYHKGFKIITLHFLKFTFEVCL